MIRKSLLLLTLLGLTLIWTGCIEIRMETELKKDGSGKGRVELAISPRVTEILTRYEDLEDLPETDITYMANLDGAELEAIAKRADVDIQEFRSEVKDGRRTVSVKMEFDSLEDYSWVLGHIFDEVGDGFGVFAGEEGQLVFKEAQYDFSALEAAEAVDSVEPDLTTPCDETLEKYFEMMNVIKSETQAVKVVHVVQVPGEVIETDATSQKGRTCTWDLDFAAIVSDKDNLKPRIVFSGKGLKIEPQPDQEF